MLPAACGLVAAAIAARSVAEESFEAASPGEVTSLDSAVGRWQAEAGHAEVRPDKGRTGSRSLRLLGGEPRSIELLLPRPTTKPAVVSFHAERWTRVDPFEFTIDAAGTTGPFTRVREANDVRIGGFLTRVEARIPAGTARIRLSCSSPAGVMLDDVELAEDGPAKLLGVTVVQPVVPVLVRKPANPVLGIGLRVAGTERPLVLESVRVSLAGTTRPSDVAELAVIRGGGAPTDAFGPGLGDPVRPRDAAPLAVSGTLPLEAGENWFWVVVRLADSADIDGRVDAAVTSVTVSGRVIDVAEGDPAGAQRMGVALRLRHDDGSDTYRIPGLVRTNAGSLVAAYDVRYKGGADLPADIDVGTSRSTDGGRTWEPMRIALDMGRDPRFAFDGVGDPCIVVDRETGRIWVAALWSHGKRAWHGSGPGMTPDETGQLVMAWSDDDGRTWSRPRNITTEVKDPAWRLVLVGPGAGITTRDGTLVVPAQFKDANNVPHSTLIWSKDRGETWHIGTGVKAKTTESQLVELADGSIMINCRDDRGGARTVAVTSDLGGTWQLHPTDRSALPESVCQASLLAVDVPGVGRRLLFSNPATTAGRHTMTLKVSADEGLTWPEERHTVYDRRNGLGYSCLAPVDEAHVGVLYEGLAELYFLRLPLADLLGATPR